MKYSKPIIAALAGIALAAVTTVSQAQEKAPIKIAFPVYLSSGSAGPFGEPEKQAADLLIEALNSGTVPAPYATKGINGRLIQAIYVDEAADAVTEYRNAVEREKVDSVVGYSSSANCKAIAPVVEELKTPTVMVDCGTTQIFEDIVKNPKYLFRTGVISTADSIGAALYVKDKNIDGTRIAGINQNYAFGQDMWNDFIAALTVVIPESNVVTAQYPKLAAGQYGAEVSALMTSRPSVVFSSFWGGDLDAFVLQAAPRGIFARTPVILTCGEAGVLSIGKNFPEGVIIGARGPFGFFAPDTELARWFKVEFKKKYGKEPSYPAWKMAQGFLGLKAAWEKAGPDADKEATVVAFEHLEFDSPAGVVKMSIGKGHQAIQAIAYGKVKRDANGVPGVEEVRVYSPACVNPPEGTTAGEWIKAGFPGAQCD